MMCFSMLDFLLRRIFAIFLNGPVPQKLDSSASHAIESDHNPEAFSNAIPAMKAS